MLIKTRQRATALAAMLAILFTGSMFQANVAHADPEAWIGIMRTIGQHGEGVRLDAYQGCPNINTQWTVEAVLTDSASNSWTSPVATTTTNGEWQQGGVLIVDESAAIGAASVTVRCAGTGLTPVYPYYPFEFEVTQQETDYSSNLAKVGKNVTFSSQTGGGCPNAANIALSIWGTEMTSEGFTTLAGGLKATDTNGNWSIDIMLDPSKFSPDKEYFARAECYGAASKMYSSYKFIPGFRYHVAMGDSFSSGEGAFNYYTDSGDCHRSSDSYPAYLSAANKMLLTSFPACSGAVTDDLFNQNAFATPLPAQFDSLDESTDIVTLTIGGNDAGFADIMDDCISRTGYSGDNCSTRSSITSLLASRMSKLAGTTSGTVYAPGTNNPIHSLHDVLTKIAEDAPNAKVYIAGYPKFFGAASSNYTPESNTPGGYKCSVWGAGIASVSYTDAQWLNDKSDELNGIIYDAVADLQLMNRFTFVPPTLFNGHGLCDSSTSYMNGVHSDVTFSPTNESMHPNVSGMEYGYGVGFSQLIN